MSGTEGISSIIVFIALLLTAGIVYPSAADLYETSVKNAEQATEQQLEIENIDFTLIPTEDGFEVKNTGVEPIDIADLTVIIDAEPTQITEQTERTFIQPDESITVQTSGANIKVVHQSKQAESINREQQNI